MTYAVAFDTLKLARKLESAGFPPKQAQDASAAISESFSEWQSTINLATREDVQSVKRDMQEDLRHFKNSVQEDFLATRADLRALELKVEARIAETKADIIKWVVGTGFAQAAFILAVLKLH